MTTSSMQPEFKKTGPIVMVALDTEKFAPDVLRQAVFAARMWERSSIHIVHVIVPLASAPAISDAYGEELNESQLRDARDYTATLGALATDQFSGDVVVHLVRADPCDGILRAAERVEADLLVVGTHDYRGVKRFLLGSVASKIAERALCPVFVARPLRYPTSNAPTVEPVCHECAKTRAQSGDPTAWCERHRTKHPRGHLHYEYPQGFGAGSQILDV